MAQYLTLSRAARLVGVKRGTLQKQISDGQLPTFEGMIALSDLLNAYPQTQVEDSSMIERVDYIKRHAMPRSLREHSGMPDIDTLSARVARLSEELAQARAQVNAQDLLLDELEQHIDALDRAGPETRATAVESLRDWLRQARRGPPPAKPDQGLLARDALLRLMAAQVHLFPSGHEFFVEGNENILEAGLRAGLALDYGCSDGSCGRCKARLLAGKTKKLRNHGDVLSADELSHGMLLMCCHTAVTEVELETAEADRAADIPGQRIDAQVARIQRPSDDVAIVHVKPPRSQRLRFLAGQYVTVSVDDVASADCFVASCPCDETSLQFHVPRRPDTPLSEYVFNRLTLSDVVSIEGPKGTFVLDTTSPRSLLFLAWDTGFAPIKGLAENAIAVDVAEDIHLYWCNTLGEQPYLHNLCRAWQDALDNFHYTALTAPPAGRAQDTDAFLTETLHRLMEEHPDLSGYDVYIAAPAHVVDAARNFLTARGLSQGQLYSESHGMAEPTTDK
jgi:CDP-4-dehydro-6-deoxyglucose reductase